MQPTDARTHCLLALEYRPDFPEALVNLGIIDKLENKTADAKKHFIEALRIDQEQAQAYNNLGVLELEEKDEKVRCAASSARSR